MTEPTNPNESPFFAGVHTEPPSTPFIPLSQDETRGLREKLVTSIIQLVVQAITGIFSPGAGGGGLSGALGQLTSWATNLPGLAQMQGLIQGLVDNIFEGITGLSRVGNLITDLFGALRNIPFLNVLGIGGPSNIGESILSGWSQAVGGLVGVFGGSATLADMFNVHQEVSSNATRGKWSFDILGIRADRPLSTGFLRSSISSINLDTIALQPTAPTVDVTPTTALMHYTIIERSMDLGAVSWQGNGTSGMTAAYVNIYKMNPLTGINDSLLHNSATILGLLSGGADPVPVVYSLPTPVTGLVPGDIIGTEIVTRGGTHHVAGATTWIADQSVFPRRYSSVRDSSATLAPASITPTYSNKVPFIEIAVSAGDIPIPHSPEPVVFNTPGSTTLPVPDWANEIQMVINPGAGGGHQGGTWGIGGEGGKAGLWQTISWVRGVDFDPASTPILAITVGAGGIGADGNGANGGNTVVTLPATTGHSAQTLTAVGGLGSVNFDIIGSAHVGTSPGNTAYDDQFYAGGLAQETYGANGNSPGGAGAGGNWISFQFGGNGAAGIVNARFKQ